MKKILTILIALSYFSCEDKYYKDKYDVELSITNKTDTVIPKISVNAGNGAKIWVFQNVKPGGSEHFSFNIKRDLGIPEGGLILTAFWNKQDSIMLNTGYFTNWHYEAPNPGSFDIFGSKIEMKK
jgi:hypothetical protein